MKRSKLVLGMLVVAIAVSSMGWLMGQQEPAKAEGKRVRVAATLAKKDDAALNRTRKTVRMLDDLYKTAVVLITTHYVNKDSDLAAGSAAVALFAAMKKKGWHEVRLVDATGDPIEEKNSPKDGFEKTAVKQLKSGKGYYETVVTKKGQRYLRAATPIPVVLKKCVMCHDHYKNAKKGEPIGILSYTLKIE
ncbi:MAG: hypothetical protein Tsb009_16690 [Planctomycetaceae bacterium]